jgi:beta-lactamase class A
MTVSWPALAGASPTTFSAIERASGGKLGVCAIDTTTGKTYDWRADTRFPFCSSFKGPLAAFVLWQADRGVIQLDAQVSYTEAELLPYAPITRASVKAGKLSFEELCSAAVEYSDNTAANLLLRETGGPAALTAWMRAIGDAEFTLTG